MLMCGPYMYVYMYTYVCGSNYSYNEATNVSGPENQFSRTINFGIFMYLTPALKIIFSK